MPGIMVAVINASTVLTDAQVQQAIPALQTQVSTQFFPAWGIDATLAWVPKGATPDPAAWQLVMLDNSDQAGALGYHDVTAAGQPLGKVFAGSDKQYGTSWSVTMSHELLEMIADPGIDLTVFIQETATTGTIYALEVADAPEGDQYAYDLPGADGTAVAVSDFVYPAWFQSWRAPGAVRYDQGGHITAPFQLLPGGYIGVYVLGSAAGWTQRTADHALARPAGLRTAADFLTPEAATGLVLASRAPVGSRRERRRVPRDKWLPSRA